MKWTGTAEVSHSCNNNSWMVLKSVSSSTPRPSSPQRPQYIALRDYLGCNTSPSRPPCRPSVTQPLGCQPRCSNQIIPRSKHWWNSHRRDFSISWWLSRRERLRQWNLQCSKMSGPFQTIQYLLRTLITLNTGGTKTKAKEWLPSGGIWWTDGDQEGG